MKNTVMGYSPDDSTRLAIALPAIASLIAGLYFGSNTGYWFDELWSIAIVSGPFSQMMERLQSDFHPPGYHVLLWGWVQLIGNSEAATHALSALCIAGMTIMTGMVARTLSFTAPAIALASLFAGLSLASLHYAAETRASAFLSLLTIAALYFPITGEWSLAKFAASLCLGVAAIYSHYAAVLTLFPAVFILALMGRERKWSWLWVGWGAAMVPYIYVIREQATHFKNVGWLQPPTADKVYALLRSFAGNDYPVITFTILTLLVAVMFIRRQRMGSDGWLAIAPLVLFCSVVGSYLMLPIFHLRYLLPLLPWLGLTLGYSVSSHRLSPIALIAALLILVNVGVVRKELLLKSEDWKGSASYVLQRNSDLPVVTIGVGRYYAHYLPRVIAFPENDPLEFRRWLDQPENREFWFIMARDLRPSSESALLQQRTDILESALFERAIAQRLRVRK